MKNGPLDGFTVIDFSTEVSGPLCTQILGDFGANIIKVETLAGDSQRKNGFILEENMSSLFIAVNRNKKSISVNLKTPEGKEIITKLINTADIVVHNMRIDAAERLGIDYNSIKSINKSVIHCIITGFDQRGTNKNLPVFDDTIQAACGLAHLNSDGDVPQFLPTIIADKVTGLTLCNSIMAALVYAQKTGKGQSIEVPMFETMVAFSMLEHLGESTIYKNRNHTGYKRILKKGRKVWKTSDGYIAMLPFKPEHWSYIFKEFNKEDIGIKLGVAERLTRNKNIEKIYETFSEFAIQRTTDEWLNLCHTLDIPVSKINSLNDLIEDNQLESIGFFKSIGDTRYLSPSSTLSESPATIKTQAPNLGEDTVPILVGLGYTEDYIDFLKLNNIIRI